jgi:two-component system OmpR family response regulator
VCRRLRESADIPIIMVTARTAEAERVAGLEGGADDYLSKPFSSRELLARIRAQARRARGRAAPRASRMKFGALVIDVSAQLATLNERRLALTSYEFSLLRGLAERARRVLSREQLLELIQGSAEEAFDRSIDVHVSRLRRKLEENPKDPRYLKTVRGAGYVFAPEES